MDTAFKLQFEKQKDTYELLGNNIVSAINQFLSEKSLTAFAVTSRVKTFKSFSEKIVRKGYKNPFQEMEDLVGVRVIVYYPDEIEQVVSIIDDEFDVQTSENKSQILELDKFGYRSFHNIVTIPENWTQTPNYRGLSGLKCEIQVRTLLMHAWAEIEHKLQYKNEESVPSELRRKLFRLSAKFEEADEQFQELRNGVRAVSYTHLTLPTTPYV